MMRKPACIRIIWRLAFTSISLFLVECYAQVCIPDHFMKRFQGNAAVYTNKVITTPQDDVVTVGSTLKLNGDFLDATDGWVTKLSPRGSLLWSKRYYIAGFNSGGFFSIENATDSSYLVTGRFGKYKRKQDGSLEQLDAATFLIHLDKFGNLIWMKRITNYIDDSFLSSITRLQDNSFLLAGNIFNRAGTKLLLLNISLSGNVYWYKLIFSDSAQFSSPSVKQLNNGQLIVMGITQKFRAGFTLYDQGYYFLKLDAGSGDMIRSTGLYINTGSSNLPTGHDNIREIIELTNDTLLLCSSFSGDRFFGRNPGTKQAILIKTSPNGQFYKADGYFNTDPGCMLMDARPANGNIRLLLDDGYRSILTEVDNRSGAVALQKAYGKVFSLLMGDKLLDGQTGNRIYFSGRGQFALMGLMKTENDGSIPCIETPSQMIMQDFSSFFRTGRLEFNYIQTSFPFAFEEWGGGIGRTAYPFVATTDCIVTCCDNIQSDTTQKELCNEISYRLPDNSIVRETGMYYVNLKNANNCDSIAYYDLKFSYKPVIDLGPDTCFTNEQPIILNADSGYVNYNWMGTNSASHTYVATRPGKYNISITNFCGTGVDEIEIFEDCEFPVYMPTAFTPGNDGLNDLFGYPPQNKNKFIHLRIFNRVGQQVFQTRTAGAGWNGRYNNLDQPIGVYVYLLQLETLDGRKLLKKGTFALLR